VRVRFNFLEFMAKRVGVTVGQVHCIGWDIRSLGDLMDGMETRRESHQALNEKRLSPILSV